MKSSAVPAHELQLAPDATPEFALLGFLSSAPAHGYELHRQLTSELGTLWHASLAHVYNVLKRLEQKGLIAGKLSTRTLPAQRVFHLTAAGHSSFERWLDKPCSGSAKSVRLEFLARLYFTFQDNPNRAKNTAGRASGLHKIGAEQPAPDRTARRAIRQIHGPGNALQIAQLTATLKWLRDCASVIDQTV